MTLETEIRNRLLALLDGTAALEDFEDWFVQSTWNVRENQDPSLRDLVFAVELRLAEHTSGHLSEDGLRHELASLVKSPVAKTCVPQPAK